MRNGRFVRKLAGFLAALTLLQCGAPLTALAAEQESDQIVAEVQQAATPALQNGTAIIPSDATPEQVKEILCQALVSNADEVDAQSLEWEYHCKGTEKYTGLGENYAWGSINGFESQTGSWIKVTYTHPALVANGDGSYQVRLVDAEGNAISDEVTLTKAAKLSSSITLKEGCEVVMPYKADATVDYDALRENVFNAVVDEIYPADITVDDVSIEYEAKSQTTGWFTEWVPFEGESVYPAISEGSQKIRISYAENDEYYGTSAETTVTITATAGDKSAQCQVTCTGDGTGTGTSSGQTGTSGGTLAPNTEAVIVNADGGLNIRSGPGTNYEAKVSTSNGATVTVLEDAGNGWDKIKYALGHGKYDEGYVMGTYLAAK